MKKYKLVEGGLAWRAVKVMKPLGCLAVAGFFLAVYSLASADDLEMHRRMEPHPVAVAEAEEVTAEPIIEEVAEEPASEWKSLGTFTITAYCPCSQCCGVWADGITASGVTATEGVTVAADTNVLPFGTVIRIDGHEYTVQDRGGAIQGNRLDIYMSDHQTALDWGVQTKEVEVKR